MIGDRDRMPAEAMARLQRCMDETSGGTGLTLVLALSYSSRWEIARACRRIAEDAVAGRIDPAKVDDSTVERYLDTASMPDPDLLIRTGGDMRLSNFLLWQAAYAEIYLTPLYWPDFGKKEFCEAVITYQGRERRFGKTSEQVAGDLSADRS